MRKRKQVTFKMLNNASVENSFRGMLAQRYAIKAYDYIFDSITTRLRDKLIQLPIENYLYLP